MSLIMLSDSSSLGIFAGQCELQLYLSEYVFSVKSSILFHFITSFSLIFKDSIRFLCSIPTLNIPVFKPYTVTPGAAWPLLWEGTALSVFVDKQLSDLPGVQPLEKKSEQMSVLQTTNNNQQLLQALADQLHMEDNDHVVGSGHGTSLCLAAVTANLWVLLCSAACQIYVSLRITKWQLLWEGKNQGINLVWKVSSFNNLFGVRTGSCNRRQSIFRHV